MKSKLEASFTSIISALIVFLVPVFTENEIRNIVYPVSAIVSPFLALIVIRIYNKLEQPEDLVQIKTRYKASLKSIKKALKDKNMSPKAKKNLQQNYDEISTLLATADSDYLSGKIIVDK